MTQAKAKFVGATRCAFSPKIFRMTASLRPRCTRPTVESGQFIHSWHLVKRAAGRALDTLLAFQQPAKDRPTLFQP